MKYRILLDIHWVDMLVEADSEEEARDKVFDYYRKDRPFGGRPRMMQVRIRKPWKHQLTEKDDATPR